MGVATLYSIDVAAAGKATSAVLGAPLTDVLLVSGSPLEPEALDALAVRKDLQVLHLHNVAPSEDELATLKAALPETEILVSRTV